MNTEEKIAWLHADSDEIIDMTERERMKENENGQKTESKDMGNG